MFTQTINFHDEDPLYNKNRYVLVCGQLDLKKSDFDKYYIPEIDKAMKCEVTVLVGNADGSDTFTLEYLAGKCYKHVVIANKKNQFKLPDKCPSGWIKIYGFAGYPERDKYLVSKAEYVIGFINGSSRSIGSGTFLNVLSKEIGHERALKFQSGIRLNDKMQIPDDIMNIIKKHTIC